MHLQTITNIKTNKKKEGARQKKSRFMSFVGNKASHGDKSF